MKDYEFTYVELHELEWTGVISANNYEEAEEEFYKTVTRGKEPHIRAVVNSRTIYGPQLHECSKHPKKK